MKAANIMNNFDAVAEVVGSLVGMSEGLEDEQYLSDLIDKAHGKAADAFDVAAASAGRAGRLTHMFEFGTAGITRGQVKFTDPTDEWARLWVHQSNGNGAAKDIYFTFRPAFNRNPRPNTKDTGVPSKYIRKISRRKYVFWNKAKVMETGEEVQIRAKNGAFLFIPFGNKGSNNPNVSAKTRKRNFVMWNTAKKGPIVSQPGKTTKGTFTAFWVTWWASQGEKVMSADAMKNVNRDIKKAERAMERRAKKQKVKPVSANRPAQTASKARRAAKSDFGKGVR